MTPVKFIASQGRVANQMMLPIRPQDKASSYEWRSRSRPLRMNRDSERIPRGAPPGEFNIEHPRASY